MFNTYIRKPEAISAVQVTLSNIEGLGKKIGGRVITDDNGVYLQYPTLREEVFVVIVGDYLAKDQKGRLYAIPKDEFRKEYQSHIINTIARYGS